MLSYIANNQAFIPNYGERYRQGDRISTGFVESAVNWNKRFETGISAFGRRMMKKSKRLLNCLPRFCMLS
jgi:hypothetical protein